MDWLTLFSTAIGAALALGGTLLAYILNSRERRDRDNRADRRRSYLDFVLAVEAAHAALRRVADPARPHDDLVREAREAMSDSGIYGAREKLIVTAHPAIIRAAEQTLHGLVAIRSAVREGATLRTPEYHDAYHQYSDAIWALRRAARADLGGSPIAPEDLGKVNWDARENCGYCQASDRAAARPPAADGAPNPYLPVT